MKTLAIGEARRRLTALVRMVAAGDGSIAIGPRGRPLVALVPIGRAQQAPERRPLVGLVEVLGTGEKLALDRSRWLAEIERSLARTARQIEEPPARRRAKR